jgi:formamidopyrimidine-DNA glycosylase
MPELPEVETVRSGLEKYVVGKRISTAQTFHPRTVKPGSIAPLSAAVDSKIQAVKRRGKFLWLELDRDFTLVAHLGMSGQLPICERDCH